MKAHAYCEGNQCFVTGDLDFSSVVKLWKESLPMLASMRELTFDLSKVTFANSAGVTLLIEWLKYADREKKTISFTHIPASIVSLARISGVDGLIKVS
jgi:phospholipid transport system transporter-binding protein